MDDPYPHVWCSKGHWEGAEPSEITEDPWKDCEDFLSQNVKDYHGVERGARNGVDSSDWMGLLL